MCVPSVQFVRKAFGKRWYSLSTLIGDTVCIDKKSPVDGVEVGIDISDHLHAAFTTDGFLPVFLPVLRHSSRRI